ncbi:2-(5''-triphosphoribosyl)-3'-dephosphocoenzyme- A synthase [Salmonella sp. NCTC 11881]|nr:2-(5''-triphosphoribosyl)-3'-dephosphocoenzyme- A synthase [Salmonella sp. NCTC 11881]
MNVSVVTERRTPAYSSLAAGELNGLVARALLTEARLTPKPGLVDIRNSGAHRDMDLAAFERSTTRHCSVDGKVFYHGQQHGGAGGRKCPGDAASAGDGL